MAAVNPNLRTLKEKLDLSVGRVNHHESFTKEQLHEIAAEAIGYNSNLIADKIPRFEDMVKKGIIKYATYDRWYINGSYPF